MNRTNQKQRVLIVDDTSSNLVLLNEMLSGAGYAVSAATNGADALESARLSPPDMVLLDILMPGMDGYEVLAELKSDKTTSAIPVLLLSALDEPDSKTRGFELGACDYVTKPFHLVEVLARMSTHLRVADLERRLRWSEGAMREGERLARMGTWTRQISTGKVEWSDELFGLFGVDRSANRSIAEILEATVEADDLKKVREVFTDPVGTLEGGRCVEFSLRGQGGDWRRFQVVGGRSGAVSQPGNEVFVGVVMDLTRILDRRREDDARTGRFQSLVQGHPDAYALVDGSGRILESNANLARLLGREDASLSPATLAVLDMTDSGEGTFLESMQRAMNSGLARFPSRVAAAGGSVGVEATSLPLDPGGSLIALFLRRTDASADAG